MSDNSKTIEYYLDKPYWVIDILPKQVPAKGKGQYFAVEKHLLTSPHVERIYQKFADLLLNLNCYDNIVVSHPDDDEWTENPAPEVLEQMILERKPLNIVLTQAQAMISITGDDHYITVYNPDEESLNLLIALAYAEGLHVWKP